MLVTSFDNDLQKQSKFIRSVTVHKNMAGSSALKSWRHIYYLRHRFSKEIIVVGCEGCIIIRYLTIGIVFNSMYSFDKDVDDSVSNISLNFIEQLPLGNVSSMWWSEVRSHFWLTVFLSLQEMKVIGTSHL